jgi:hypothetical protein
MRYVFEETSSDQECFSDGTNMYPRLQRENEKNTTLSWWKKRLKEIRHRLALRALARECKQLGPIRKIEKN